MNAGIHSERFIRYCYKFWMKNIYNRSDMVICPSKFAEKELKAAKALYYERSKNYRIERSYDKLIGLYRDLVECSKP